jgi:TolB-like protein
MLGTTVSQYEILKKLGEGGMGVVYQARDRTLGRLVALKFLNAHLVDSPEQLARFEQEARTLSSLNHPHIATIYGFEQSGEHRFLVLEYLPGGTLAAKLAELKPVRGAFSIEQSLDYAIQIAEGLRHAHNHGVIHRDIKAFNVMFTEDGALKITDFGLARLTGSEHLTRVGRVVGTLSCMSPEQAQGKPVDHRSDIFSFGILMYQLFAGEVPFRAPSEAALLHQIVYQPAPAIDEFRAGVPASVERIVMKALEKDPNRRHQTMEELLIDLRAVRQEISAGRASAQSLEETVTIAAPRHVRRKVRLVGAAIAAVCVLAAAFAMPPLRERAVQWLHPPRPLPQQKRIAVLPFTTSDPANQAFSDGLNDIISYKLAQLEQFQGSLMVVAASEVNNRGAKTPSAARDLLGANLAIVGTVVRTGDRCQAFASLVDTRDLVQLRSATIEARLSDPAEVRDRVISRVAQMLDLELTAQAQNT